MPVSPADPATRQREVIRLAEVCDRLDAEDPAAYQPHNGKVERWRFRPNGLRLCLTGHGSDDQDVPVMGRALSAQSFWCVSTVFIHPGRTGFVEIQTPGAGSRTLAGRTSACRYVAQRGHEIEFRFDEAIDVGAFIADAVKRRVMVVDDDELSRAITERLLRKLNADTDLVSSGAEAVAPLSSGPYDLIIVDLQMPEMDGFATLDALREAGCTAPISTLTADGGADSQMHCQEVGFDGFMAKPITLEKLRALLTLSRRQPLVSTLAGDSEMGDLITRFLGGLQDRVVAVQRAITAASAAELEALARVISADAGGVGFATISECAKRLELAAKKGDADDQRFTGRQLAQLCARARASAAASNPEEAPAPETSSPPGDAKKIKHTS